MTFLKELRQTTAESRENLESSGLFEKEALKKKLREAAGGGFSCLLLNYEETPFHARVLKEIAVPWNWTMENGRSQVFFDWRNHDLL